MAWDEFMYALIFMNSQAHKTITVAISEFTTKFGGLWNDDDRRLHCNSLAGTYFCCVPKKYYTRTYNGGCKRMIKRNMRVLNNYQKKHKIEG